jgi:hypothetical protein
MVLKYSHKGKFAHGRPIACDEGACGSDRFYFAGQGIVGLCRFEAGYQFRELKSASQGQPAAGPSSKKDRPLEANARAASAW